VSAVDSEGQTIWITDAHQDEVSGSLCVADEKLTAFVEPESGDSELPQIVLTS